MTLVEEKKEAGRPAYDIMSETNRSHTYLLPMLGESKSEFSYFKQCFFGDEKYPELDNNIFVLLERKEDDEFYQYYIETILAHGQYVSHYEVGDNLIMYVFAVPNRWQEEYTCFKEGKYSKFKGKYKAHVLNFHSKDVHSTVAKVLYRAEDLYKAWEKRIGVTIDRTQEIGSMPDYNREIYGEHMKIER